MTADVSVPADNGPLRAHYRALTQAGALEYDPAQRTLLDRFDALLAALAADRDKPRSLGRLLGRKGESSAPRGIFVYGAVGRGKTMLMDLFFEAAPIGRKRRVHFHEFMADVHERVHAHREQTKGNGANGGDPVGPVADELAREEKLLCFDEFAVNDIADAMILGRLFTRLFESGMVLVATSNIPPDNLYAGGLNRQLFLPFIDLLKRHVDVVRLDARTDFRLEKLASAPVYVAPLGADADQALDAAWRRLTGTQKGATADAARAGPRPARAASLDRHRPIFIRRALRRAARRRRLPETCARFPHHRHRPNSRHERDNAERSQALHRPDRHSLRPPGEAVISAAAEPDGLFVGTQGFEAQEFKRTASRLTEMRSAEYMGAAHGPPDSARS